MRFLSVLVFSLFISANAQAALNANDWQGQLQSQLNELHAQSPSVVAKGNVTVQQGAGLVRATLPVLTVTSPDHSYWTIPSIILQASESTGAVTIVLPATITRSDAGKKEIARLNIAAQSLNARWNDSSHSFEALNGLLQNITFSDTIANAKSTISGVSISANKGSPVQFAVTGIHSMMVQNQKAVSNTIAKANISYEMPSADQMTLARLIGYLNPVILLAENKEVVLSVNAEQISLTGDNGRITNLQRFVSKLDLQPKGSTVSGKIDAQAYIVTQSPVSAYGFILPRQAELSATFSNLPAELISLAPGMSIKMARLAMDQAGTLINISKLDVTTFDNGKLKGDGNLKADNETPSGFTGRITLKIENLKDLIAANQLQLLQPDKGTDRSGKTQSVMAMMMLQGMGKQDGNDTEFVLDLTADGQTLVNGQDMSSLVGSKTKSRTIDTAPAMPVQKVNSSNL